MSRDCAGGRRKLKAPVVSRMQLGRRVGRADSLPAIAVADEYRWHIVVRGPDPAALARGKVFRGWYIDVDPMSTL